MNIKKFIECLQTLPQDTEVTDIEYGGPSRRTNQVGLSVELTGPNEFYGKPLATRLHEMFGTKKFVVYDVTKETLVLKEVLIVDLLEFDNPEDYFAHLTKTEMNCIEVSESFNPRLIIE